jgi:electron transfer flavoprotein beta subunit
MMIRAGDFDMVLCGNEAIDGSTGQVGPIIAENLDIPQITYVCGVEIKDGKAYVRRDAGAVVERYEVVLPALFCVLKGINTPRERREAGKEPRVIDAAALHLDLSRVGNDGSPTKVVKVEVSDAKAKSYVTVDDSLPWDERIKMIIDGGIDRKTGIDLWRGSARDLADRIMCDETLREVLDAL